MMPLVGAHIPRNSLVNPGDQQEQPEQHNIILDDVMRNVTSSGRDDSGGAGEIPTLREETGAVGNDDSNEARENGNCSNYDSGGEL